MELSCINEAVYAQQIIMELLDEKVETFVTVDISRQLNDTLNQLDTLIEKMINMPNTGDIDKIHTNIKRMNGLLFLINICNFRTIHHNETVYNTLDTYHMMSKIIDTYGESFNVPHGRRWSIDEKTLVALMVSNDIKPRFYRDYLGVSKDSLAYQIKKAREVINNSENLLV